MEGQSSSDSSSFIKQKFHLHNSRLEVYAENAIKRNNVKSFIKQGVHTSQGLNLQNNQNRNLSQHLLHLKNSCNDLKKDITDKQNTAVKLKDQTLYTAQKVKQLESQRQKLQQKIGNLMKDVQMVQSKKQSTSHTFKTYQHILWRMKKDQITNTIRRNNLQKQIMNMEKQLKLIQNKLYTMKQYEQLSYKGLKQASKQIQSEHQHRNKRVYQMNLSLEDKKISQNKKQQRHNQTKSIQEIAAGDLQDSDLIRMKKFFEVQMFLKNLLKDKMQRLKDQYQPYQLAFFKIKSQTTAKDANSLKTQFFNFESQYQQKTAFIKHLQQQITHLENQRKKLNEQYFKAKQSQLELLQEFQGKNPLYHQQQTQQTRDVENQRQYICRKSMDCELRIMKVRQWVNFQSKRVNCSSHNQSAGANFNKICDFLLQQKMKKQLKHEQNKMQVN